MNKKDFYKLRNEITLNSLFLKDYNNSFYIKEKSVCEFFDSAIKYINDCYKEKHGCDIDIFKIKISMLYDYYKYLEFDPLTYNDYVAYLSFTVFSGLFYYDVIFSSRNYLVLSYYFYSELSGLNTTKPRKYKIYSDNEGDAFIIFRKQRYYLNDFVRRDQ